MEQNELLDYIVIKQIRVKASSADEAVAKHATGTTIGISAGIDKNSPKTSDQSRGQ